MKQYSDLVYRILGEGEKRSDRTGVGTLSVFGHTSRYDLRKGFPAVTTKKLQFRSVVQELLWFLSGSTNTKDLGNGIWDAWADDNGELGPVYGQQFRGWTAHENEAHLEELNNPLIPTPHPNEKKTFLPCRSIDQFEELIQGVVDNPFSRRHVHSVWNVGDIEDMALPPCHILFQIYVSESGYVDLQLYQRSADVALGVPFNIAEYSLLLHMICVELNRRARERSKLIPKSEGIYSFNVEFFPRYFIHTIGDAHIYLNHVDTIKKQMINSPLPLPTLLLKPVKDIYSYKVSDISLRNYKHQGSYRYEIAV